jgi:hypothetical protein
MPRTLLKVNGRFGGTCRFHLQGRGISQARYQHEAGSKQAASCRFLAWFIFQPWRGRRHFALKFRLTFNGLHRVISRRQNSLLPPLWQPESFFVEFVMGSLISDGLYFLSYLSVTTSYVTIHFYVHISFCLYSLGLALIILIFSILWTRVIAQ